LAKVRLITGSTMGKLSPVHVAVGKPGGMLEPIDEEIRWTIKIPAAVAISNLRVTIQYLRWRLFGPSPAVYLS
jgi:hypothetical protein